MKNSLLDAFNIEKRHSYKARLSDYEIFPDKDLLDALRTKIVQNLIDKNISKDEFTDEFINKEIESAIAGYDLTNLERNHIFNLIDDEINGYGPISELLEDPNISEIMVNSPEEIYIETNGQLMKDESISFINEEHIRRTIERLIEPLGKTINASNPMIDSRLPDGSRINAIIPPLSPKGSVITIRKFQKNIDTMDDWIRTGSLTPWMADFLQAAVSAKLNIIITGGAGVGKTSLLNILSGFIGTNERIITIEDAAELQLHQKHVISLETIHANYDSNTSVSIQDLVRNALRMRPDRIIVGEVRGKEAFDMLQAMNTGHEGSITTMHANSPHDALNRLETMIMMGDMEIPVKAVREYIEKAVDIVVHIERMSDGKRKVTKICEIDGFAGDTIRLNDIFIFKQVGLTASNEVNGEYALIEKQPKVYQKIKRKGIDSLDEMMSKLPIQDFDSMNYNYLFNKK